MHPEFWLVLLRVLRVPLTALLGTVPLMLIVVGVFAKGPNDLSSRAVAGLSAGLVFALLAMPVLALERLPERWQGSRAVRLGRAFYLIGGVGFLALLLIAAFDTSAGVRANVFERLRNLVRDLGYFIAVFHLFVGAPLIADQLNHHFGTKPLFLALPWGLLAVLYMGLIWALDAALEPFDGQSLYPDGGPVLPPLVLVGGRPLGLAAGRVMMDKIMVRVEEAAAKAEPAI